MPKNAESIWLGPFLVEHHLEHWTLALDLRQHESILRIDDVAITQPAVGGFVAQSGDEPVGIRLKVDNPGRQGILWIDDLRVILIADKPKTFSQQDLNGVKIVWRNRDR